jgi:hypothetical protein
MKLLLQKVWIYILRPIWSFFINLGYWTINLHNLKNAIEIRNSIKDLSLKSILHNFIWTEDYAKDWTPWIITITNRKWKDDCDGSATLAKYWYKTKGIKSEIIELFDSNFKIGHAICIRKDHTEFTSNNDVITIKNSNDWKTEVLNYFDNKYSIII